MKKTKYFLISFLLIVFLIPSISLASWWNPLSWFEDEITTIEIPIEISTSTSPITQKTKSSWWNPLSWGKKETNIRQENPNKQEQATTTKVISEKENLETENKDEEEKINLELETAKAKAEVEKYKLEAEQTRLEIEKLKRENALNIQTQTQVEIKKEESKNTTITLPNGAIVEIDENGNVVKTVKEASIQPIETSQPVNQRQEYTTIPKIELSVTKNSLSAIPSTKQQLLIQFKITTENEIKISKSIFKINTSSGYGKINDITSAILINQNGGVVAGPKNGIGNNNGIIQFTDMITIRKGTTEYKLKADIGDTFIDKPNIYVSIDVDSWEIE